MKKICLWALAMGLVLSGSRALLAAEDTEPFYDRLVKDLAGGRPLVTTVYVALCDNDSQGIVPVKNRRICDGDVPEANMYWRGRSGIHGYLAQQGWKREYREAREGTILIVEAWTKRLWPGRGLKDRGVTRPFDAVIVALAYRGSRIHDANLDYLRAVHQDVPWHLSLTSGLRLAYGGGGHVVGYVGHDYFMDAAPGTPARQELEAVAGTGDSTLPKGTFALACVSDEFIRPAVTRDNVYLFAMNRYLTFPSAWTVGGIVAGIAQGGDGKAIHRSAVRAFARGQQCGTGWANKAFAFGP